MGECGCRRNVTHPGQASVVSDGEYGMLLLFSTLTTLAFFVLLYKVGRELYHGNEKRKVKKWHLACRKELMREDMRGFVLSTPAERIASLYSESSQQSSQQYPITNRQPPRKLIRDYDKTRDIQDGKTAP